jgi:hypothetical protein
MKTVLEVPSVPEAGGRMHRNMRHVSAGESCCHTKL